MNDCIIKYCIDSFAGIVAKYEGDIIIYFEHLEDDDLFNHNSINLTKLYESYLVKKDKTTFHEFYFFADKKKIVYFTNNYNQVMETLLNNMSLK